MATPYILNRAHLEQFLGSALVAKAVQQLDLPDLQPVIDGQNALADGYVASQVSLPPSATARAQVAPLVAELVLTACYVNNASEHQQARREAAFKTLREIASGTLKLHVEPVVDNPATSEDESLVGTAAFGASKRLTKWDEPVGPSDW